MDRDLRSSVGRFFLRLHARRRFVEEAAGAKIEDERGQHAGEEVGRRHHHGRIEHEQRVKFIMVENLFDLRPFDHIGRDPQQNAADAGHRDHLKITGDEIGERQL